MEKIPTKELYSQLQDRIIMDLKVGEITCPVCKGLRFVYIEKNEEGYIESCNRCYNGRVYVCKYCGKDNGTDYCHCKEAKQERNDAFRIQQTQKDFEAFQKAEKVHYKDYEGYFILCDDEHIKDIDDVEEWIHDKLVEGEDIPEYLWAVEGTPCFSLDLRDVISDKCEDGYEEMYSHLDTESPSLLQAQDLVSQWEKEQGESLFIYNETNKKAVIINDLVEKIRREISDKQ